jgi:hypothetical protein
VLNSANMLPITLLFFALSLRAGAVAPSRGVAAGMVIGLATAACFIGTLAKGVDSLRKLRYATPFYCCGSARRCCTGSSGGTERCCSDRRRTGRADGAHLRAARREHGRVRRRGHGRRAAPDPPRDSMTKRAIANAPIIPPHGSELGTLLETHSIDRMPFIHQDSTLETEQSHEAFEKQLACLRRVEPYLVDDCQHAIA